MKTFFTEVDSKSDKSHLREINQLLLRLNLESPRTQLAMKELNLTKYDCQLKTLSNFLHYHNESRTMYLNHLQYLKDNLSNLVNRRREIIGPSIKIVQRTPKQFKQYNFVKKVFDHDLKMLYQSELQIKTAQQKNTDKIYRQVEEKLKSISYKAKQHNNKVERKLSLLRERRKHELDDRLSKSLDFDSKFEPIQKTLQESKMKFQIMMQSKTQQTLDYHRQKKKNIIEQEEQRRTKLQYSMETSQRSTFIRQGMASQDRIQQAQLIEQEQQNKVIQKIGNQVEKSNYMTSKNQQDIQKALQKFKDEQDRKFNKVHKNLNSKTQMQSQRESMINQELQDKIMFSNVKAKQRLDDIQQKMKQVAIQKQQKQQELLNKYMIKMERRNDRIMDKHVKLRQNLKKDSNSRNLTQQQHQLVIEKDELNSDITKVQRLVVSKSSKNIQELLNNLRFN
ncbi:unnamed protein product [Paramecium pentaurelia]|uniref:Uncharacterized protein n=1 Tax=Paramecium pentaurelia TaxID=43138 RepID=A0A8S1T0D8_9CILI|nr:unnamed protein product [Paramecium pentaurelia]